MNHTAGDSGYSSLQQIREVIGDRLPVAGSLQLTPIGNDGKPLSEETTTVVAKDLSLSGICFSHYHRLPYRRVLLTLNHPKLGRFAVEAEIVWTRLTPLGLYESGCRLLRTVNGHTLRAANRTGSRMAMIREGDYVRMKQTGEECQVLAVEQKGLVLILKNGLSVARAAAADVEQI